MNPKEGTRSGSKNFDGSNYSLQERKRTWMRKTRIRLFMQMELIAGRDELERLIISYHCAVINYSEVSLDASVSLSRLHKNLGKRTEKMADKVILPPSRKIIIKTHYLLPVSQQPPTSPPLDIQSLS